MTEKRKPGRPPLPEGVVRNRTINIRVTDAQHELLNAWAIAVNVPLSELAGDVLVRTAARRRPWV